MVLARVLNDDVPPPVIVGSLIRGNGVREEPSGIGDWTGAPTWSWLASRKGREQPVPTVRPPYEPG